MTQARLQHLRAVAAVAIVAAACPVALFGSGFVGCAGGGFNSDCAFTGAFLSPIALILSGIVAAMLVHGRRGYPLVVAAVVLGMVAIFVMSALAGTILPFDPVTGTLWTLWFLAPVTLGYVIGAVGVWLVRGGGGAPDERPVDAAPPAVEDPT